MIVKLKVQTLLDLVSLNVSCCGLPFNVLTRSGNDCKVESSDVVDLISLNVSYCGLPFNVKWVFASLITFLVFAGLIAILPPSVSYDMYDEVPCLSWQLVKVASYGTCVYVK